MVRGIGVGILAGLALAVIVAISAPLARGQAEAAGGPSLDGFEAMHPPAPAPDVPFLVDGQGERTLADYRGKVVVVNFWARWCAPCVREMPALDRLQAKMAGEGVVVLALTLDRAGLESARSFYEQNGIEHLAAVEDSGRRLTRALGVTGLPTTVIVDPDGNLVGRLEGPAEWDSEAAVNTVRSYLGPGRG